jgi:hypothetical protein
MGGLLGLIIGVAGAVVVGFGIRRHAGSMKLGGLTLLIAAIFLQLWSGGTPAANTPDAPQVHPVVSAPTSITDPTATEPPLQLPSPKVSKSPTPVPGPSH